VRFFYCYYSVYLGLIQFMIWWGGWKRIWFHFEFFAIFGRLGFWSVTVVATGVWILNIMLVWWSVCEGLWLDSVAVARDWIYLLFRTNFEELESHHQCFINLVNLVWRQFLVFVVIVRSWTCLFKQLQFLNWKYLWGFKFQLLFYLDCCLLLIWWSGFWAIHPSFMVIVKNCGTWNLRIWRSVGFELPAPFVSVYLLQSWMRWAWKYELHCLNFLRFPGLQFCISCPFSLVWSISCNVSIIFKFPKIEINHNFIYWGWPRLH
jgi:hypothetical protein